MPLTPEFHPEAVREAEAARNWYLERSPVAAKAFADEIEEAVDRVCRWPELHATYLHGTRRCLLRRFPYIVVYRRIENVVEILAVAHARRKPGYWRDRTAP